MKPAKMKLITIYVGITIAFLVYFILNSVSKPSHFTITPDTNVSSNPKLAKYVSQDEIDDFAFRYWDIDDEREYKEENTTTTKLRHLLKAKKTDEVLNFIKSNNLHIDTRMSYKLTPLMYSSFYNDDTTARELIRLGADVHATDTYKLSPLAYAIENNSTKTAKLLLDSGVKFEELRLIQNYWQRSDVYGNFEKIVINGDNIKLFYNNCCLTHKTGSDGFVAFDYMVDKNFVELVKIVLEAGYNPGLRKGADRPFPGIHDHVVKTDFQKSLYTYLDNIPNHEPMLELLLKYNVVGKPDERILKAGYEQCRKNREEHVQFYKNFKSLKAKIDSILISRGEPVEQIDEKNLIQ